ncbi:MAG: LysE family transporter [Myxococcota bacterium]
MVWLVLFIKAIIVGFAIAVPVGPVGFLCIRRAIAGGVGAGFIAGVGAALADALAAALAAFGLTAISDILLSYATTLQLIGGVVLIAVSIPMLFAQAPDPPSATPEPDGRRRPEGLSMIPAAFVLTVSNPATVLAMAGIFSGFGLVASPDQPWIAALIVLGVFIGASGWWLLLSILATVFRDRLSEQTLIWINRGMGVVIAILGVLGLISGGLQLAGYDVPAL